MERQRNQESIKKGPWTAEEDEILKNFVQENGPREWSSIRSKGLLPRTGKSCRLRWVNKLQPNLKKGCKFSAEEERVVLELQATLGNKWAAISTYLPGRTDNDVKNFWSTRQKRLARLLRASSHPNMAHGHGKVKALAVNEASESSFNQVEETTSSQCHICSRLCSKNANALSMLPPPHCQDMGTADPNPSFPPAVDGHTNSSQLCIHSSNIQPSLSSPFGISFNPELPKPALCSLPLVQESPVFGSEFGEPNFMDAFTRRGSLDLGNMVQQNLGFSLEEFEATGQNFGEINDYKDNVMTMPDNLFDDLPDDMLDDLDKAPTPTSSS